MVTGADFATGRHRSPTVGVEIKNALLRSGIERILGGMGIIPRIRCLTDPGRGDDRDRVLIVLLSEVDEDRAVRVRAAQEAGAKVLFLLSGDGDVAELSRVGRLGTPGTGFLAIDNLDEHALLDTVARMEQDEVAIPGELASGLLSLAGRREAAPPRPRLTPRETEALALMVEGLSNKQMARRLGISEHGAKRLVANILAKLDCGNRTLAVARALREGLHHKQH
ncbi:helix-turn-helix transcriptional regulator [Actinophytocola xanthii]|uniref:HTH luxR-type domain-containing protein n=1 Tax=Actinophytocola xanthii TaxID=1912961 RepID=A0A1Q8CSE0_9PSEU|nr:LuxR C-terminal-related transcriptional regulator [Actinophytocola xanthii]OLF17250.1 hypothetical protein BU204_12745 [Actinophytocola xanthii]